MLASCANQAPVPQDQYYFLPSATSPHRLADKLVTPVAVAPFQAEGIRRDRALLYIDSHAPMTIRRYHYHHWAISPPKLIQEHMLAYLRLSLNDNEAIRLEPGTESSSTIRGKILRFERLTAKQENGVIVSLELSYMSANEKVWQKVYTVKENSGNRIENSVEAFGKALEQIYNAFLNDISPHSV